MDIQELYNYELKAEQSQLNEARPYGRMTSLADRVKGYMKSFAGGGHSEMGAREIGQMANDLYNNFRYYAGQKGMRGKPTVPYDLVFRFMKGNGMDTSLLGTNRNRSFNPEAVSRIFMKATQEMADQYADQEIPDDQQPEVGDTEPAAGPDASEQQSSSQDSVSEPATQGGGMDSTLSALTADEREQLLSLIQ